MATRVNQMRSLLCPICLNTFSEPKLLVCSHTFCTECLKRLFKSQKETGNVPCPICRKTTAVPEGDIGSIQTNIPIKDMVEDFKNQSQICSICKTEPKPLALTYCQECEEYMCVNCHKTHAKWDKFTGHEVVKVEDILSGKVTTKQRRKCKKHPSEVEECFCAECKKYVCFRCGMMEHTRAGHDILEGMEHEESQKAKIQELRGRADHKKSQVDEYVTFVEKQREALQIVLDKLTGEVGQSCEESIHQLEETRDILIKDCKGRMEKLDRELQDMKDESRLQIGHIEDVSELVANGVKGPLECEALTAHETLCKELEGVLGKTKSDYDQPRAIANKGESVSFQPVRSQMDGQNKLDLGKIQVAQWVPSKTIDFPVKDGTNCIASMHDGRIAVGSRFDGLLLISLSGSKEAVLKGTGIRQVVFLSDGRFLVRDLQNNVNLYNKDYTKTDVTYATLSHDKGGFGGLTVDVEETRILTSFSKIKKIYTYKLTGGRPVRKVVADFDNISQLFSLSSGLLLAATDDSCVNVFDASNGNVKHSVTMDGVFAQPAPCLDGTVLIAWVKHSEGLVTIERYTRDLVYLKTLITDWKIAIPRRPWYHLREFIGGEIAFCTPDKMYVFCNAVTLEEVEP